MYLVNFEFLVIVCYRLIVFKQLIRVNLKINIPKIKGLLIFHEKLMFNVFTNEANSQETLFVLGSYSEQKKMCKSFWWELSKNIIPVASSIHPWDSNSNSQIKKWQNTNILLNIVKQFFELYCSSCQSWVFFSCCWSSKSVRCD